MIGLGLSLAAPRPVRGGAGLAVPFQSVGANGWSVSYATPPAFATPETFRVSRQGFDTSGAAVTISEDLACTKRIRQPYPAQASLTADQVALSDYIYSTDTISGAVNASAEASPKPICNWVMPDRLVVGNTVHLEIVAFHRNARSREQVACVEFSATDGTTTVVQKVSTSAISTRGGDANPVIVYQCDLDISTLTARPSITVNAKVYPWIGGAASVANSADNAVEREFSPRTFRRDTAAQRVAYVRTATNGGNDTTGVVSTVPATASALPFATVLAAINALHTAGGVDGATIYIGADGGTPFVLGSPAATRTQSHSVLTITREAGVARANARVSFGAASFRPRLGAANGWLRFFDVGIVRTGTSTIVGESASTLRTQIDNCSFDNASNNAAFLSLNHGYYYGTVFSGMTASPLNAATYEHRIIRGCTVNAIYPEGWLVVGCSFASMLGAVVYGTRSASGSIFAYNQVRGVSATSGAINIAGSADVTQAAVVQNLFEVISATTAQAIAVSADGAAGNTSHIVLHHNTVTGFNLVGRQNIFYDEGATARTNKLMSVRGNIWCQINTKSDVFRGTVEAGADASARVGNWAFEYAVGCDGEFSQFIDASGGGIGSSFAQDYAPLSAKIGTSATVRQDPLFTAYQGVTSGPTAGAGGGTYTLQAGSPAKGMVSPVLRYDLAGAARSATLASAGAYE